MISWLEKKYNHFLFKKYGFNAGLFFDGIPKVYKQIPLWSPSLYRYYEGQQMSEQFTSSIENVVNTINNMANMLTKKESKEN